jgi:glycerol-3-phosphate acyltransferase PlsX
MDDAPLIAVRRKKHSSIVVAMQMLHDKRIQAFVSAGNTGALVVSAMTMLSKLPGIERPALLASLPTLTGSVAVVDIGGNVASKPQHLLQFARMGAAYQRCSDQCEKPRVGLLNIGIEAQKGTASLQQAYQLLDMYCSQSGNRTADRQMAFVGNVEGRDVFQGGVDVLVSDGFAGNIFLKTAEGVSAFILDYLEATFSSHADEKVRKILNNLQTRVHYAEYPGAILCGVDGVIVKCHGYSSCQAMMNGIKGALKLLKNDLLSKLKNQLKDD